VAHRRTDLKHIQAGSVIVDVAIDQGGCVETSRVTTHRNPTYEVDGVVHYCVGNMPGAVARTSTLALTNVTLPWAARSRDTVRIAWPRWTITSPRRSTRIAERSPTRPVAQAPRARLRAARHMTLHANGAI
jgi:hypothetical protein